MDNFGQGVIQAPPISRIWTISIVVSTIGTTLNMISPFQLIYSPALVANQPWRLFTSFCYFGDLSVSVIWAVFTVIRWSSDLEENFNLPVSLFPNSIHKFDQRQSNFLEQAKTKLKSADYLYFVLLIGSTIILTSTIGFLFFDFKLPFSGLILHEILCYISCRLNPYQMLNLGGLINLEASMVPIITSLIELFMNNEFRNNISLLFSDGVTYLPTVLFCLPTWKAYVCLGLGHLWWFLGYYYFEEFHNDKNPQRLHQKLKTPKRIQQNDNLEPLHYTKLALKMILLPPWYWVILSNIENNRGGIRRT